MKVAKIVVVLFVACALVNSAKLGYRYFLPQVIPLCSNWRPGIYDLAGIVMIIAFLYALTRIGRRKRYTRDSDIYSRVGREGEYDGDIPRDRYR